MSPVVQESFVPFYAVAVSMAVIPAILALARSPNAREACTLAAAAAKFVFALQLLPGALRGESAGATLFDIAPGIGFRLVADPMGVYFALVASGLWILTSAYSIGYMRGAGEKRQTRYYASFALSLSSTIGVAFADNLLVFLVFYEMLTLATYPLVVHKQTDEALRSGRMYLTYALTAGLLFLAATVWIYLEAGTVDFRAGGALPAGEFSPQATKTLFLLLLIGVGVKSGVMPLHSWLPAAMVAPTPVSALLHAVAVVKSGAFGVLRVTGFVFGPETMRAHGLDLLLASLAGATILLASLIALRQDNLKRRLAYSTVGHLSYIVMGAALLSTSSYAGGLLHLSAHALMKITLFFCAGAIYVHAHKSEVSQLDGLGRAMPWTFGAFTVGALGLAGVPPVNGFVSKWWLGLGSLEAGHSVVLGVFLLSGLLNAGYFLPVVVRGFFRPAPDASEGHGPPTGEASAWMVAPLCLTAALALLLGVFPNLPLPFFDLARMVAESVTGSLTVAADAAAPPPLP